jgi:hypothetical protein
VGAFAVIWSLWLCRNDKVFNDKVSSPLLMVYWYTPFMIVSLAGGASKPIYEGLYTVGDYGEGYFFPSWVAA